jgi:cysteinyl-tRNA synthetase
MDSKDITNAQKELITKREEARRSQDWGSADRFRDQLKEQGLEINDTAYGSIWRRIS